MSEQISKYDVWLDLECSVADSLTVLCTLFAQREFSTRPLRGESITFWPGKNSAPHFNLVTVVGIKPHHYVPTEIESLDHQFYPSEHRISSSTYLRLQSVQVASVSDARSVVSFLTSQHGFELDPYATNRLDDVDDVP